jgi:hypothetical protein
VLSHQNVGPVVADSHIHMGTADEFAEKYSKGAEQGRDAVLANELQ